MQKLAFFDFCDTLVNFQTADFFVDFIRKKRGSIYMKLLNLILFLLIRVRIIAVLNRIYPEKSLSKKIKLLQLRNLPYDLIDQSAAQYYNDIIKPNLILPVIEELRELANKDYEICVVSAGYSIYLKYFAQDFNVAHLISTEIAFNREGKLCSGTIAGKDCIGDEKINQIERYFEGKKFALTESISFSDSISDLPLLQLTDNAVVVSRGRSQSWSIRNNFREIIWD
jgi:HAD superfamily hydrolase (TIGR01490 family)